MVVGIRPESLRPGADGLPAIEVRVDVVEPLGDGVLVHGTANAPRASSGAEEGEAAIPGVSTMSESRSEVVARLDPSYRVAAGTTIRLGVETGAVHLFDATTGKALR